MITQDDNSLSYVLTKLAVWIGAILSPIAAVMGTMVMVVLFSLVLEWAQALKDGVKIPWNRLILVCSKFALYLFAVLIAHLVEANVVSEVPWTKIVSGLLVVHELKSAGKIYGKLYGVNFFDALKDYIKAKGPQIPLVKDEEKEGKS